MSHNSCGVISPTPAFTGKSFPDVCMAILAGKLKSPSEGRDGFPPQLDEMLTIARRIAKRLLTLVNDQLELASPLDHGRIKNGSRLLELLAADGRVRGILFGHVHQAIFAQIGHLALFGSPSTCVQFKPLVAQFALDSQAPGCRWLSIKENGEIVSRVQRLADGSFPAKIS